MNRRLRICAVIPFLFLLELSSFFFPSPTLAASDESEPSDEVFGSPRYQSIRPQWGIEITTSLKALGSQALVPAQGSTPFYAINLQAEYQPTFLQNLGVLSFGLSTGIYLLNGTPATNNPFAVWEAGAQARYQARFFHNQFLVPMAAYGFEYLNYNFVGGPSGALVSQGPTFGLWLLLNSLDSNAAGHFWVSTGITRSYLVVEARLLKGTDANINFEGPSYYFGLRFEF